MKANVIGIVILVVLLIGLFVGFTCTYIVDEREQIVITRFSKPVHVVVGTRGDEEFATLKEEMLSRDDTPEGLTISMGAGLKFKMPFIDTVERFPDTLLEYDADPEQIVTRDKKILIVDNFSRWRIEDPLLYRIRVGTEVSARSKLDDVIYSVMREELGRNNLIEVIRSTNEHLVAEEDIPDPEEVEGIEEDLAIEAQAIKPMRAEIEHGRDQIMANVLERSNDEIRDEYGIRVIDVRIKRADLVQENLNAVFARMEAERERVSKRYESEGDKEAQIIRSETDKTVQVMLAEAQRDAQEIRGDGDAEVVRIYADAFGADPELYKYIRSLEVMRDSTPEGSEIIIGVESGLYQLLEQEL